MATPSTPLPFDNVCGPDFQRMDSAFALCQSAEARLILAQTECSHILRESSQMDLNAYLLLGLIGKHCGDVATVLPRSDIQELQKLSSKARDNRIIPLSKIGKAWGETVIAHLGLGTESYNLLRYASKACKVEPDWQKARIKLNQIISVKGPWRKSSCDRSTPVTLHTLHFEYLSAWPGEADFNWKGQPPIRLRFGELSGYDFDHEGFLVISHPVAALEPPISELPLRPDRIGSDSLVSNAAPAKASDKRRTNDRSNTKDLPLERTQTGRVPRVAGDLSVRRLRSTSGTTLLGMQRARVVLQRRRVHGRRYTKAPGRPLKSSKQSANGGDVNGEAQGVRRRTELDDLLLADDCVTDILLDDVCKVKKYGQTFHATAVVRISLFSGEGHDEDVVAALSSLITSLRTPVGLDSPDLPELRMQLTLYCDMLSSDCPFELATTHQYSQHEEWCVLAKKTIEKGTQIKYLKGANATVTSAIEGTYSSLGRIDGACGKRYITAGPVRFVNHDCKPNSKLEAKDDHTVVTTIRSVKEGEEITVYYSADFFGRGNENCSCATCKPPGTMNARHLRRFWPLRKGSTQPSSPALSSKGCKDLRSGRLREEQAFQKAIIKQTDRILKEQSPESQLFYDYKVMKDFFKSMRPPSQDEAQMLSEEDAKELIESGAPINGPIFVSTPNLVNWTASDPLTAFFEEYSPDQMKWTVDVQTPLKLRTNADETASRMTIGQLYERFRCEGTEYLNALELANPIPSSDPEFLRGINSRVYHRALHRCASEGKAGRTRVTDGRHWALVGQSGALSPPHEDWGGKDTFITCQRSRIGYGWFSNLSDDDRKAWHLLQQICPSQARFRVLNRSETVFFHAGTIHFVFRLVSEPHTVAFSGFNFRWSGLHNSAQVMLNQLKHPEITNEDVTNSDLLLWTEIANMVENESSPKRLEYLGGEEGRKQTQTHCSEIIRRLERILEASRSDRA